MAPDLDRDTTNWVPVGKIAKVLCDSFAHGTNGKPHQPGKADGVNETVGRRFDIGSMHYRAGNRPVQAHRRVQPHKTRGSE